jgi:outer membrane protein TolC
MTDAERFFRLIIALLVTAAGLIAPALAATEEKARSGTISAARGYLPDGRPLVLTRETLVKSAMENNPELLQLGVEKEQTRIDLKSARAGRYPDIGAEIRLSHIANPMEPISVTAGEYGSYEIPGEGEILIPPEDLEVFEGMEPMLYEFIVTLEQPIFTWGKIRNSIELYKRALGANELNIELKRREITTTITVYLYSLYFLEKIDRIIQKQREAADRLIFISEKSYENGFIVYSEFLEARIKAKEIDLGRTRLEEQRRQLLLELEHLTGISGLRSPELSLDFVDPNIANYPTAGKEKLIERALETNVQLELLGRLREIADYKRQIAKGGNYLKPDIGLRFELSYGGPRFPLIEPDWYGKGDYNIISTLAFVTSIYDGGKLRSEILMSEEELKHSTYEYRKGRSEIERFISTTLLKLDLNRDNIEYYTLKKEADADQVELKRTRYEAEAAPESEYLMELIEAYKTDITLYQEKIDFFSNYFTLQNVVYGD